MSVNYREPQWLLPNEKNLQYPAAGATQGSGLTADRHSLYSMYFNVDHRIDLESSINLSVNSTISFWYKTSTNNNGSVVFGESTYSYEYLLQWGSSVNKIYFRIGSVVTDFTGITEIEDGNWHHYCIIRTGANAELFVDGASRGTVTGLPTGTNTLIDTIGATPSGTHTIDNSYLDEIAFWSRSLSSDEVTTLYNSGSPSNPMLLSGKPVAYYPLGEQARKPGTSEWRFPNEVLQSQTIDFDGTDYINLDKSLTNLNVSTSFSISCWVNISTNTNYYHIVGAPTSYAAWDTGFGLYTNGSGIRFWVEQWNGANQYVETASLTNNQWYHILATFNTTNGLKLYVNGGTPTTAIGTTIDGLSNEIFIGSTGTNTTYGFNGKLSNIAIWNSDQSANIANIYNYGAPQTSYTVTPTAWYKLDKTSEYAGLNANWHNALDFNGSSNYLTIPSTNFVGSSGEVSYSFWLNPDTYTHPSSNDYGYIFSGAALADGGIAISEGGTFAGTNGTVSAGKVYYWNGTNAIILTNALTENVWSNVVLVFDASGSVKGYLNGVLSISASSVTTPYKSTFQNIGKFYNSTHYLNGKFSNLAVFNQAISAEDVKYLYNGGTPQTNISFEPTSWWKLNNLAAGIQDSGSASVNATATDSPTVVTDSVAVDQWNFDNAVQSQTPNWSSALDFDGSSDAVIITDSSTVDTSLQSIGNADSYSFSFWINTTDSTSLGAPAWYSDVCILELRTETGSGTKVPFNIGMNSGKLFFGRTPNHTTSDQYFESTTLINTGEWVHCGVTINVNTLKFYINNSLDSTHTFTVATGDCSVGTTTSNIQIGARTTNAGALSAFLNGKLNNIALFNTELNASAISTLYNNGQPETAISSSPVSWWKLDNTTTGIQDSAGSNNGTNNGATEIQTNVWTLRLNAESDTLPSTALVSSNLQFNSAYSSFSLNFDAASSDYIDCGNDTSLNWGTGNGSVSCWFKTTQNVVSVADLVINGGFSTGGKAYILYLDSSEKVGFYLDDNSSPTTPAQSSGSVADGNWHHVVGVRESGNIKLYLDGLLVSTQTDSTGNIDSTDPLIIGAGMNASTGVVGNFYDGKIDETAVWNRALNQSEITSIYNNGYPKDITALSPISWWRLGEDAYYDGTDFTIPNKISGAPNGTSNGMPATALVADAPGSYAAGLGSSLALDDRLGDAPLSTANSLSFNMIPSNRVSYPAGYVPTQADNVYSMAFDGINDYVDVGTVSQVNSATACTLCYWGKKTASNKYLLFGSQIAGNDGIWLSWWSDGNIYFSPRNGGNTGATYALSFDTDWRHFAGVYDGSSAKIYINGNLVSTNTTSIPSSLSASAGTDFNIGYLQSQYTSGNMDEVAIFDYALTPRQIKQDIYNGTTSGKTADLNNISNLTPPVAWYRMGD